MDFGDGAAVREAIRTFEEDDPRRPPYELDELDELGEAARDAGDTRRWHGRGADWLAVRLQYGRGVPVQELCDAFGVPETTLRRRRNAEGWVDRLSERDARRLSRRVWLGGLARGVPGAGAVAALCDASEWRGRAGAEVQPLFTPCDPAGAPAEARIDSRTLKERPDGAGDGFADPQFEQRKLATRRLQDLIADLERDLADQEAAAAGEADAAVDGGRTGGSAGSAVVVEGVGEPGADAA